MYEIAQFIIVIVLIAGIMLISTYYNTRDR